MDGKSFVSMQKEFRDRYIEEFLTEQIYLSKTRFY
jgi:hypothetical protein